MFKFSNIQYFDHLSMPFRHFLYFFPRLSTLLILTILRHLSLKPGHIAHFNGIYAPSVPQHRTHGALQRRICPTCPSNPDTWHTSTAYLPHMSLNPGHMKHLKGGANIQRRCGSERQRRRQRQTKADKQRNAMKLRPAPGIGPKRAQLHIKQRPVPEIL